MAIDTDTISKVAYHPANKAIFDGVTFEKPMVFYDWKKARCDTKTAAQGNGTLLVTFDTSAKGDTIFLPYGLDQIHSVRLPSADPAITCFMTAGMSGCKLYIDRIKGSNDLIVYHANGLAAGSQGAPKVAANVEVPALTKVLDGLHTSAQAKWASDDKLGKLELSLAVSFGRNDYYTSAVTEEDRLKAAKLFDVNFIGGTTIVASVESNKWHFHWQTWGACDYTQKTGIFSKEKKYAKDQRVSIVASGELFSG